MALAPALTRRLFLSAGLVAVAGPRGAARAEEQDGFRVLRARAGTAALRGPDHAGTPIWGYDGLIPGPTLRCRRGEEVRVRLINELAEPTSLHWHGVRLANSMDGTRLTQAPVAPGASFDCRFTPPDAGTFWYHPHVNGGRQLARGLSGVLIVEEVASVEVDRDVVLVLDDWALGAAGAIDEAADDGPHWRAPDRQRRAGARASRAEQRAAAASPAQRRPGSRVRAAPRPASRRGDGDRRPAGRALHRPGRPHRSRTRQPHRPVRRPGPCTRQQRADPGRTPGRRGPSCPTGLCGRTGGAADPLPDPKPLPANPLPDRMDFRNALRLDLPSTAPSRRRRRGGNRCSRPSAGARSCWR